MDLQARLADLAKIAAAPTPVVSVYLTTRWRDEQQRERVRVFLKNALRQARETQAGRRLGAELDWVERQGEALVAQSRFPEAHGVALFACHAVGLWEVVSVPTEFEDILIVGDAPYLRPLAAVAEEATGTLVVFVDSESARLIPFGPGGAGEPVTLESEVPGRHRRGGWALLAQSRYQRHIAEHRGRHFDAVAETLGQLIEKDGLRRVVLVGERRTLAALGKHLPGPVTARVVGSVAGARHEPDATLVARAAALLAERERTERAAAVDAALTEAAKGGRAVAGLEETLDAVNRGAVRCLFLQERFAEPGRGCPACGALQPVTAGPCRLCSQPTRAVELGGAMVSRVLAAGGAVEAIAEHAALARVGGVVALLRYPL